MAFSIVCHDNQMYFQFDEHDIDRAIQKINEDLRNFCDIAKKHALTINPFKSTSMLFSNSSGGICKREVINCLAIFCKRC